MLDKFKHGPCSSDRNISPSLPHLLPESCSLHAYFIRSILPFHRSQSCAPSGRQTSCPDVSKFLCDKQADVGETSVPFLSGYACGERARSTGTRPQSLKVKSLSAPEHESVTSSQKKQVSPPWVRSRRTNALVAQEVFTVGVSTVTCTKGDNISDPF